MDKEATTGHLCQYHINDHAVISDLKDSVRVIIEGQQEMRTSVIQLTEAFKNMERIEARIEKIEDLRSEREVKMDLRIEKIEDQRADREERREKEIRELRAFMNKALGILAATTAIGSVALKLLL